MNNRENISDIFTTSGAKMVMFGLREVPEKRLCFLLKSKGVYPLHCGLFYHISLSSPGSALCCQTWLKFQLKLSFVGL